MVHGYVHVPVLVQVRLGRDAPLDARFRVVAAPGGHGRVGVVDPTRVRAVIVNLNGRLVGSVAARSAEKRFARGAFGRRIR